MLYQYVFLPTCIIMMNMLINYFYNVIYIYNK